jgi:hypothetical protein
MAIFPLNPLKWFAKKGQPVQSRTVLSASSDKRPVPPEKGAVVFAELVSRGNVFMHLIALQQTLRSMELALRQKEDSLWLAQKAASQVLALRQQADTVGEGELAKTAGLLFAYLEAIAEGKLILNEKGLALVREFAAIFKSSAGDRASEVRSLDIERMGKWEARYKSLMGEVKPIGRRLGDTETNKDDGHNQPSDLAHAPFSRDALVPVAEAKSANEHMQIGEAKLEFANQPDDRETPSSKTSRAVDDLKILAESASVEETLVESTVAQPVKPDPSKDQESAAAEKLEIIDDLETLIFIGRKKG